MQLFMSQNRPATSLSTALLARVLLIHLEMFITSKDPCRLNRPNSIPGSPKAISMYPHPRSPTGSKSPAGLISVIMKGISGIYSVGTSLTRALSAATSGAPLGFCGAEKPSLPGACASVKITPPLQSFRHWLTSQFVKVFSLNDKQNPYDLP